MATNKFIQNLTSSSAAIKDQRATLISADAQASQEELLRKLKQEQRDLLRKRMALSDIYPDSELSLLVTKNTFDADRWSRDYQTIGVQLLNKEVEIKVAQATYDEWFGEVTATDNAESISK